MNSQSDSKTCRWGIMSTATIGQKNWQAIRLSGNGTVAAVASRNLSSSEKYINQLQAAVPFETVPEAVEGYQSLIDSPEIDAVYIPLPTGMRREWVIKAAEAGKHVLCEKPCALSYAELQEMVEVCRKNSVQFMDGIMYMHGPRLNSVREAIDTKIGKIKRITTQFSFFGDEEFDEGNIRTNSVLEPFGCLGDLGWYTIRFALWVMNYQLPNKVYGRMISTYKRDDSPNPVPMEIECGLQFADGVTSSFYNSFLTGHQQWAHVSGTEGSVHIPDFVLPFEGKEAKFSIFNSTSLITLSFLFILINLSKRFSGIKPDFIAVFFVIGNDVTLIFFDFKVDFFFSIFSFLCDSQEEQTSLSPNINPPHLTHLFFLLKNLNIPIIIYCFKSFSFYLKGESS